MAEFVISAHAYGLMAAAFATLLPGGRMRTLRRDLALRPDDTPAILAHYESSYAGYLPQPLPAVTQISPDAQHGGWLVAQIVPGFDYSGSGPSGEEIRGCWLEDASGGLLAAFLGDLATNPLDGFCVAWTITFSTTAWAQCVQVEGIPSAAMTLPLTYTAQNKDAATAFGGMAVSVHPSGTGFRLACALDETRPCIGLAAQDIAPTFSGPVQTEGLIYRPDWTAATGGVSLTGGALYYLDPTTPGMLTTTVPVLAGEVVQLIGTAVDTQTLDLEIVEPILL